MTSAHLKHGIRQRFVLESALPGLHVELGELLGGVHLPGVDRELHLLALVNVESAAANFECVGNVVEGDDEGSLANDEAKVTPEPKVRSPICFMPLSSSKEKCEFMTISILELCPLPNILKCSSSSGSFVS